MGAERKLQERKPNRLAEEKSPYLLEHAFNPVAWYPWGKEALAKARNDNKPILLSIGYSTCHWCHVMRDETFEDEKVASFINRNFIPIKVDREERPEVDAYYMAAVQAMTGGGGWPLNVFLTPDLRAFYGGTYFPPEPRLGLPSFMQVLEFVSNLWKERRAEVTENAERVAGALAEVNAGGAADLAKSSLDEGYTTLMSSFDGVHGGFGAAPKFPLPMSLAFLLRYNYRTGKELAMSGVVKTLEEMMAGGIRDHLGGGFHRYSTDRVWLVPHFEKMLYDNALLAKVYLEAYQATGKQEHAEVVRETLGWLGREMTDPGGGFYSAQDADTSEGEGEYYTWTPGEVAGVLGPADGEKFCRAYGVTRVGNFEGRSILHLDPSSTGGGLKRELLAGSKQRLYEARLKRPRPATDKKILTSWNGLAISAMAAAGQVLGEKGFVGAAAGAADFLLRRCQRDGKLLRRFAGGEAALEGTLEDYAFFVQGLLDLFEATAEPRWLEEAVRLTAVMVEGYEDKGGGGFYLTLSAEPAKLKEGYDGPTPSGNSVAALNLVKLSEFTGDQEFRKKAEATMRYFGKDIERNPASHTCMLIALDLVLNGAKEVVVSAPTFKQAEGMRNVILSRFIPDKVLIVTTSRTQGRLAELTSLVEGRGPSARARAYVCENFACKLPVDTPEELRVQLSGQG